MKLLIGCPVRDRAWILNEWFDYTNKSCANADIEPQYIFVTDPTDEETICIVQNNEPEAVLELFEEGSYVGDHVWNPDRYSHMSGLRNMLLRKVRELEPDFFLSLDSDILIHQELVGNLIESSQQYDAVGGRTYMSPSGSWCPSVAQILPGGGLRRDDTDDVRTVMAIMAIKLMKPKAYSVDYEYDLMGEDIGWSKAAKLRGCKLGYDGRVVNKHCMSQNDLSKIDKRCGY